MSILLIQTILTLLLISQIRGQWNFLHQINSFIPGHIYKISCKKNQLIIGNLTWNSDDDLDATVLQGGSQLLSKKYSARFDGSAYGYQPIVYSCPAEGVYYVKVNPFNLDSSWMSYSISLRTSIQNIVVKKSSWIYNEANLTNKQAIYLNLPSAEKISIKYSYILSQLPPKSRPQIEFYGNWFSKTVISENSELQLAKQNNSYLIIVINDNLLQAFALSQYKIVFYYEITEGSVNIGAIAGGSAGGLVVLAIAIFFGVRKYKQLQLQDKLPLSHVGPYIPSGQIDPSRSDLNSKTCCICFQNSCNTQAVCGHSFHKNCIRQWIKHNPHCPLCRRDLRQSQMRSNYYAGF